jgi:hypothetical protein
MYSTTTTRIAWATAFPVSQWLTGMCHSQTLTQEAPLQRALGQSTPSSRNVRGEAHP